MLLLQCNNINEIFETLQNKFVSIIDNNVPIKTFPRKESKLRQKPQLTEGILECIRTKNQLYKKYIKKKGNFRFERYKLYRSKVNMLKEQKKLSEKIFPRGRR